MANIFLKDGTVLPVAPGEDPNVALRKHREQQTTGQPQVPTGSGDTTIAPNTAAQTETVPAGTNIPQQSDSWNDYINNIGTSAMRGTMLGMGGTADLFVNAAKVLGNDVLSLAGRPASSFYNPRAQQVRNFVESHIAPQIPGYENVTQGAEIFGPAVVETALTGSPKSAFTRAAAESPWEATKTISREALKVPLQATRDVTAGLAGSTVGGEVGQMVGGETGKQIGQLAGGFVTPTAVTSGTKSLIKNALLDPKAEQTLNTIMRINRNASPGTMQIIPSLGLVGGKRMAIAEDLLGRGIFSGGPAQEARRAQYAGMEDAIRDTTQQVRGGPPTTSEITPESIGLQVDRTGREAQTAIAAKRRDLQNTLESKVGSTTPVDTSTVERQLQDIIQSNTTDRKIQAQAQTLLNEIQANYPKKTISVFEPSTGKMVDVEITEPANYGQTKGRRSQVGATVDQGQPMSEQAKGAAYGGLTEGMREAAARKGLAADFDRIQEETKRLYEQAGIVRQATGVNKPNKPSAPITEESAYRRAFGAEHSIDQLLPLREHAPQSLANMLADQLELKMRGRSNAGRPEPIPETFDPKAAHQYWSRGDTPFQDFMTQNNPTAKQQLTDISEIALRDVTRPGKRTAPGATGSTIGASMDLMSPGKLGAIIGAIRNPGNLGSILASALLTPVAMAGTATGLGKLMTNPAFVKSVVKPQRVTTSQIVGRGIGGLGGVSGVENWNRAAAANQAEEDRKMRIIMGK